MTRAHVERLLAALELADGAVPALPVPDTLKRGDGLVDEDGGAGMALWRAQTPQAFRIRQAEGGLPPLAGQRGADR